MTDASARRRAVGSLLAAALAAGCQAGSAPGSPPGATPSPVFDHAILPGQRVGPMSLGMTAEALLQVEGKPESREDRPGEIEYRYRDFSVIVNTGTLRVTRILVTSGDYALEVGASVGMKDGEVVLLVGGPCNPDDPPILIGEEQVRRRQYRGMTIVVDAFEVVTRIEVNSYKGC
jgi:hypothetical protein